jgi:hypothetical protein
MTSENSNASVIAWWSGGITSAVACRIALEKYKNVRLLYIETGSHHKDTFRFKEDCENWYGVKIETWQSKKYKDHLDVIRKDRFINGPFGARCTKVLKKDIRAAIEQDIKWSNQVWGFEFEQSQINRAIRWQEQYEYTNSLFPLIENKLSKNECAGIVMGAGIKIPDTYKLGYNNNNCIGCVKGGAGYWNKIRVDFPNVFNDMAKAEREIKATCLKNEDGKIYLDELDPKAGNPTDMVLGECGIFCQVDFAHIMSPKVIDIMEGKISIYEANKKAL